MTHWIVAPVVMYAVLAAFTILVIRHHVGLQRIVSVGSVVVLNAIAVGLMIQADSGAIEVYELGNWPAPFGIVLVLDRLSALMVMLTAVLALGVVLYVVGSGWDTRGKHFHALFQFQLMGVLGAFLTGDAFNLFVFFEVLLIASYGLIIHSGGPTRMRAGVQYVVYNLLGSTLFLFALGTIYAVTGTLNMADLAVRVSELPPDAAALIRVGAVLLLLVFAVKAAVLPLHFWLPGSYANAPGPVAALFAIMTKVGVYAILRMYTLVFGPDLAITQGLMGLWLMPAALATLVVGTVGVLGADRLSRMVAFSVIGSMGTLLIAVSLFDQQATAAALYYTVHSTFSAAALFLIVDMVVSRRGEAGDLLFPAAPIPRGGLIAALYFGATIAMAGMPPLSGFVGKLLVMDAARASDMVVWIWVTILVTSLIMIVGFARAGSTVFWKTSRAMTAGDNAEREDLDDEEGVHLAPDLATVAIGGTLAALILLTVFAGPVTAWLDVTAAQLYSPERYIDAVLAPGRE